MRGVPVRVFVFMLKNGFNMLNLDSCLKSNNFFLKKIVKIV